MRCRHAFDSGSTIDGYILFSRSSIRIQENSRFCMAQGRIAWQDTQDTYVGTASARKIVSII